MPRHPGAPVPPAEFRRMMARWGTGVSVVTSTHDGVDGGLTVNALLSVSLDPALLLVSITQAADSTPVIQASRRFAVCFLAFDQRPLSERFAQPIPAAEKFHTVSFHRGRFGLPLLDGCLAYVECEVVREIPVADHRLFVGQVVHTEAGRAVRPLIYYQGRYAEESGTDGLTLPPPRE